MSEYLQKIIYLTKAQYNTLQGGGTIGSQTGLNSNYLYCTTDENITTDDLGDLIVPVSKGGTGKTSFTVGSLLVGNSDNALTEIAATNSNTANTVVKRDVSGNFSAGTITASLSGNATSASGANTLIMKSVDNTTLHNTSGTFAFSGSGAPWSGYDWVGLQVGSGNDKFQIVGTIDNNSLLFRTNDNGGTNTSWGSWQMVAHSVRGTQVGNSTQPVYMTSDGVITAGTALKALAYEDSLTYSDVGAAAASHNHAASDINSGTLDLARIPSITNEKLENSSITVGNKSISLGASGTVDEIFTYSGSISTNTSWDKTATGAYYVASGAAFTGSGNPGINQEAPYSYGGLYVLRAGNGGAAQFYISDAASGGTSKAYGIRYRSGWNVINNTAESHWRGWATILDDKNFNLYAPTLTGTGASGSWGISITGTAANVTGTVAIDHGGTGATTAANARTNLGLGTMALETATDYAKLASPALTGTPTAPTATNGTSTTQIATTEFVNNTLSYVNAMRFKGTLGTGGTITALPASHEAGDTYRVITAETYPIVDSNGKYCEVGTLIICVADGTTATPAHWTAAETNEDGAVIGPESSTDNAIVKFDGATGRIVQNSGVKIDDNNIINGYKTLKYTTRIYPFVTSGERSVWYKITFPYATATTASIGKWFMNSFDLHFGGGYSANPSGVAHVTFYWVRAANNGAWAVNQQAAFIEGILANRIELYYRIAEPGVLYVHNTANHYNGIWIDNLYVDDTASSLDWSTTKIENVTAITNDTDPPLSAYTKITTTYLYNESGALKTNSNIYAAAFKGHADSATSANYINLYEARGTTTTLNKSANYIGAGKMFHLVASSNTSATDNGKTPTDANILQMNWDNNGGYDAQLGIATGANRMYFRSRPSQKIAWDEVAHAPVGTAGVGNATQPVYMTAEGVITAGTALKALAYKDSLVSDDIPDNAANTTGNADTATAIQTAGTTAQFYRGDNSWSNIIKQTAAAALGIDSNKKIGTAIKDLHFSLGSGSGTTDNSGNAGGITFGTDTVSYGGVYWQTSGNYGSRLHFATTSSFANGAYTRMIITHVGNVGIGTLTPSTLLQVAGSSTLQHLYTQTDATYDIGATATRWRSAYLTTSLLVGAKSTITAYNSNTLGSFVGPGVISSCVTTAGNGYYLIGGGTQYGRWFIKTIGTANNGTTQGTQGEAVLEVGNSTPLILNASTGGAHNSRGIIRIYGTNAYHTDILAQANGDNSCYLPNYDNDMFLVHAGDNQAIGSGKKPVYIAENGRVTVCNTKVGDPYTPIYANYGEFTATSPVQYFTWSISSGKYGVNMTDNDEIFKANTYSITLVVLTGESNLNAPLTWTSGNGTFSISTAVAVSGNVTGYAIIARGANITDSITFTQKDSNT